MSAARHRAEVPPAFDPERVIARLGRDVARTLGASYLDDLREIAANVRRIPRGPGERTVDDLRRFHDQKVVDDFQQMVHDLHIDTTWPACPRHPRHPMWYAAERDAWCCPRDGAAVAPLGELPA